MRFVCRSVDDATHGGILRTYSVWEGAELSRRAYEDNASSTYRSDTSIRPILKARDFEQNIKFVVVFSILRRRKSSRILPFAPDE